ncbi:putative regulatory protein [Frankia alni ACN14a]|uniref:Regulatory protein n=1 Tax=Frankia alni (strain DSM 45986 / CECT 9034 / ACN14a) TaxID=326424 RepID=Q0RLM6_FRAAA|nr:putative regulatory protein [Frankia alni ACN14a]
MTNVVAVSAAAPDVDLDGKPKANRDGLPVHVVQVAVTYNGDASLLKVKVAGEAPKVSVGTPVTLVGLTGTQWAMTDRHGISWSAREIRPVSAPAAVGPPAGKN